MHLTTARIVGIPTESHWPQVFSQQIPSGMFVASYCLANEHTPENRAAFLESLQHLPLGDVMKLATALETLCESFGHLIESFSAGLFHDQKACMWSYKGGIVYLSRNTRASIILQSDVLKVIEGPLRHGDVFFFATPFCYSVVQQQLSSISHSDDIPTAVESKIPMIIAQDEDGKAAGIFVLHRVDNMSPHVKKEEEPRPVSAVDSREPLWKRAIRFFVRIIIIIGTFVARGLLALIRLLKNFIVDVLRKDLSQDERQTRNKKIGLALIIVSVSLLLLLGGIQFVKSQADAKEKRIVSLLEPVTSQLSRAKSLEQQQLPEARTLAKQSLEQATAIAQSLPEKSYERKRAEALRAEVQQYFDSISGASQLDQLPVFYNFQLVRSGFLSNHVSLNENTAIFLDQQEKTIISLELATKQSTVTTIETESEVIDVCMQNTTVYVLADGVYENGKKVIEKPEEWKKPIQIESFGTSLYVFDQEARQIFKYTKSAEGWSKGSTWIRSAPNLDLASIHSLSIDGSMWVGTNTGIVAELTRGNRVSFTPKNLPSTLDSSVLVATTEGVDLIAVLEMQKGRILLLKKDGEYQKEIVNKELGIATDIALSSDGKAVFVSAGSVVYRIETGL